MAEDQSNPVSGISPPSVLFTVAMVVVTVGLVGWLSFRAVAAHRDEQLRASFMQAARQGAVDLTTIDYEHVDGDIQRILDSSTGRFHDDFKLRSPEFSRAVKQAQSKTEGSIVEAGFESVKADSAQVLVAVAVTTTNLAARDQEQRHWRMRVEVAKIDGHDKVADVSYVP